MSPARSVALKTCKKGFIHAMFMPDLNYFDTFDRGKNITERLIHCMTTDQLTLRYMTD